MTPAEEGAYIRLLAYQWQDKTGTLPADLERLGNMSRLGRTGVEHMLNKCSGVFVKFEGSEGRVYNKRLYLDWQKAMSVIDKKIHAGVMSGASRRSKSVKSRTPVEQVLNGCSAGVEQVFGSVHEEKKGGIYSSSILKTKTTSKALLTSDKDVGSTESCSHNPVPESENNSELLSPAEEFGLTPDQPKPERLSQADWAERIYQAYPRKVAKQAALKAIRKALKAEGPESLLDAVQAYAEATSRWDSDQRKFIPHPASWFNAGHYADDRADWDRKSESEPRSIWDNIPPLTPEIDELIESAGRLVRGDLPRSGRSDFDAAEQPETSGAQSV